MDDRDAEFQCQIHEGRGHAPSDQFGMGRFARKTTPRARIASNFR